MNPIKSSIKRIEFGVDFLFFLGDVMSVNVIRDIRCEIVDDAFKQAMILHLSNIPAGEIVVTNYDYGRDKTTIEFPTLDRNYYIWKEYWSNNERYTETKFEDGKKISNGGWEIFEMYCGGKNGRKTKVKRRIF